MADLLTRHVNVAPGVVLTLDEWRAGNGPPVVLLHATGFSRGCWRPVARRLLDRCTPVAVDLRGHGGSSKPPPPYTWPSLVDDVVALFEQEQWSGAILCGHSVGGATAVQVAARLPERVAALVLVEPVLTRPRGQATAAAGTSAATSPGEQARAASPLMERTLKRRSRWDSQAQAAEYLRARPPYDSWDAEVFASWIETGVVPSEDGGVELACPPWVEASVFAETSGSTAYDDLPRVQCPTWILRATGERGLRSTCPPEVVGLIPHAQETVVEGSGHFLPLEEPGRVVELVDSALRACAVGLAATAETEGTS